MLARKPFTLLAAIFFLIVALLHAYRLATGFQIIIGSHTLPVSLSWAGLAVPAVMFLMLLREARR